MASPENFEDLIDLLELQLAAEDESVVSVREYESMIMRFLETRGQEYSKPTMEISRFDPIRNEEARAGLIALVRIFLLFVIIMFDYYGHKKYFRLTRSYVTLKM